MATSSQLKARSDRKKRQQAWNKANPVGAKKKSSSKSKGIVRKPTGKVQFQSTEQGIRATTTPNSNIQAIQKRINQSKASSSQQKKPSFGSGSFGGSGSSGTFDSPQTPMDKISQELNVSGRFQQEQFAQFDKLTPTQQIQQRILGNDPRQNALMDETVGGSPAGFMLFSPSPGTAGLSTLKGVKIFSASQIGSQAQTVNTGGRTLISAVNTKNLGTFYTKLKKIISDPTFLALGAWAGSVAFGMWGEKEAKEQFSIFRDSKLIPEAMRTGDWLLVNESKAAERELVSVANQIALWSPISGAVGAILNKQANSPANAIRDKFQADQEHKFATGQTTADYWLQRDQDKIDTANVITDNAIEKNKQYFEWKQEALDQDMIDDAAFFERERQKVRGEEKKALEENAKFWIDYKKYVLQMEKYAREESAAFWLDFARQKAEQAKQLDDNRPSALGFGIL